MSGLELFAAALGVIAVWLTVKQNPWCWPIGLVMVLAIRLDALSR